MPSILFVTLHRPDRSPSQRFRFEQYISFLKGKGWDCEHSYLLTKSDDAYFYKQGHYLKKFAFVLRAAGKRLKEVGASSKKYDIVFIQRECFMLGTTYFESKFSKRSKIVFDFDDAIWMHQKGEIRSGNKNLSFLKKPSKTADLIKLSDLVFAGNQYLADYAKGYNQNIKIVPTTIDTDEYNPKKVTYQKSDKVCVGWSGSVTTIPHFKHAVPALLRIQEKYKDRVCFKVVGDGNYVNKELNIQGLPWRKDTELADLCGIDIGLMPLPDEEWTKGKCGLKGLQYMALEIPTIMSPVGVNTEIVEHGKNGMLASSIDEWVESISALIEDKELRERIGRAGRQTVVDKYSVEANKGLYLNYLNSLL